MIIQAPSLLLAPLSTTSHPTTPRIAAAISTFTASLSSFLHFFKVIIPSQPLRLNPTQSQPPTLHTIHLQTSYLPLCPLQSPSICRCAPNAPDLYASCLKVTNVLFSPPTLIPNRTEFLESGCQNALMLRALSSTVPHWHFVHSGRNSRHWPG